MCLNPLAGTVGRPPNFMKRKNRLLVSVLVSLILGIFLSSTLYAQDRLAASSASLISPEDKLQALASTRFHFITLKQFHSGLFTFVDQKKEMSEAEASLLNAGLNVFLTSAERETMLLDALRKNKSVQIKLPVSENVVRDTSTTIEVKPLLDKPVAFQITLTQGEERRLYDVDWSGNMVSEAVIGSLG